MPAVTLPPRRSADRRSVTRGRTVRRSVAAILVTAVAASGCVGTDGGAVGRRDDRREVRAEGSPDGSGR
ncbi:MAG TPA: hypothetical protein PLN09_15870, partial [Microthrixaceae bacterium]|nr:hypothetical protein [Microthrixaceae bacterium]